MKTLSELIEALRSTQSRQERADEEAAKAREAAAKAREEFMDWVESAEAVTGKRNALGLEPRYIVVVEEGRRVLVVQPPEGPVHRDDHSDQPRPSQENETRWD
jgi:hypothetical protein